MGRKKQPGVDKIDEDWVKAQVKVMLREHGQALHFYMPVAGMYGKTGTHDFIVCQRSFFWSIETKAGKNKPTDNQIDFAEDVRRAGGISLCINEFNLEEVRKACTYVRIFGKLPVGHDFEVYRK